MLKGTFGMRKQQPNYLAKPLLAIKQMELKWQSKRQSVVSRIKKQKLF